MQPELFAAPAAEEVKAALAAKLRREVPQVAAKLKRCGEITGHIVCAECGQGHAARYTCNLRWCPDCARRIAARRAQTVTQWALAQPHVQHVVLTARNRTRLSGDWVRALGRNFAKLRRQRPFNWPGGCRSTEVTNESRGWHVHLHALVAARWIDNPALAKAWARLVDQEFAIVFAKRASLDGYLAEVSKYAVKPQQAMTWPEPEACEFVRALQGVRLFATWGSFRRTKPEPRPCECGAVAWTFEPLPNVPDAIRLAPAVAPESPTGDFWTSGDILEPIA